MRLLSFDTSRDAIEVCLQSEGKLIVSEIDQLSQQDRQYAANRLMPTIDQLVNQAGWTKSQIEGVVVGIGPGGFTGTRIGVVTARMLGQALGLPVIGVSIFECLAHQSILPAGFILTANAKHCFVAAFDRRKQSPVDSKNNGEYSPVSSELIYTVAPAYMSVSELGESLKKCNRWYVDPELIHEYKQLSDQIEPMQPIKNMAEIQGQIAWNRLSLVINESQFMPDKNLGGILNKLFPYSIVQPLYLRNASVTLKGSRK